MYSQIFGLRFSGLVLSVALCLLLGCQQGQGTADAPFTPVNIAGNVSQNSVILQARLGTTDSVVVDGDVPGMEGWGYFQVATDSAFSDARRTSWMPATPDNDYILKTKVEELSPGTRYYYRVLAGPDSTNVTAARTATFRTLPPADSRSPTEFVMMSCPNFEKYYGIGEKSTQRGAAQWTQPATGVDRRLGMPGFEVVLDLEPDFFIGNGDNVYYDEPDDAGDPSSAKTQEELRAKWHRTFSMPRFRDVLDRVPTYWLKDDHDYRFNDADTTDRRFEEPSHELGVATFREQVPVVDPSNPDAVTYHTYRVNQLLQIWILENRDYRSPNNMPDRPEKTLWGQEQKEWLKRTLLESDATFKVIVTPTPEVGPDDDYKRDNHVNPGGFSHEGEAFKSWLAENGLVSPEVFTITGDRHWQYHSIHPSGLEEFSAGAFNSQNAREGMAPGDPASSDPEGRIDQPYLQSPPTGGFLHVRVDSSSAGHQPSILFAHYDERGQLLNAARRYASEN